MQKLIQSENPTLVAENDSGSDSQQP